MDQGILPSTSNTMNEYERGILSTFKDEIVESVDPITLVSFLFRQGRIKPYLKEYVQFSFRSGENRDAIMCAVISKLQNEINMSELIYAFEKTGYRHLATKLFLKTRDSHHTKRTAAIGRVSRSSPENRKCLQLLFRNLKRMVHDSQFCNPRQALRMMEVRYRTKMDSEKNELSRQKLADKCMTILGVELDAHYDSIACKVEITQDEMLEEMRELISSTTNPLVTDTIVYSRQANLDAFRGDFKRAEDMLVAARNSSIGLGRCLELVNLLYVEVYVKLWEFEASPNREILEALLMWGRFGLESLMDENEDTIRMWKRMFLLRMIYGLLGLGNRGNIIADFTVDRSDINEARSLLTEIDKIWNGIEIRREMFYCIARARFNHLSGLTEEAIGFLSKARYLAVKGRFLEKIPFIDHFMSMMEDRNNESGNSEKNKSVLSLNEEYPGKGITFLKSTYTTSCYMVSHTSQSVHQEEPVENQANYLSQYGIPRIDSSFTSPKVVLDAGKTTLKRVSSVETEPKLYCSSLKSFEPAFDAQTGSSFCQQNDTVQEIVHTNVSLSSFSSLSLNSKENNSVLDMDPIISVHSVNRTDKESDDTLRSELLKIFDNNVGFGSIALYEDRSLGEGASNPSNPELTIRDMKNVCLNIPQDNRINESKHSMNVDDLIDIDDNDLFG